MAPKYFLNSPFTIMTCHLGPFLLTPLKQEPRTLRVYMYRDFRLPSTTNKLPPSSCDSFASMARRTVSSLASMSSRPSGTWPRLHIFGWRGLRYAAMGDWDI